ncbi:MAG: DinB family protein [Candidatus Eisenbacteria bacterium]|mgnify:CR=1 FL=1|nr:DinB family protein [Candidatus Eisenbacteria bacterium]
MDLLDRLLEHDRWTTRELLICCRELADEQLDRDFDIGLRTLRATFHHIIRNMEIWSGLMAGRISPANRDELSTDQSIEGLLGRLACAGPGLATLARSVATRNGWDEHWIDTFDDPPTEKSFGGAIAHILTHSMHHRSQVIHMMRRLGIADVPEGDVLSWEGRAGGGSW